MNVESVTKKLKCLKCGSSKRDLKVNEEKTQGVLTCQSCGDKEILPITKMVLEHEPAPPGESA